MYKKISQSGWISYVIFLKTKEAQLLCVIMCIKTVCYCQSARFTSLLCLNFMGGMVMCGAWSLHALPVHVPYT